MDYFTALLEPHFTNVPELVPRVLALFEPAAPRVDVGMANEGVSEAAEVSADVQARAEGRRFPTPQNTERGREPYRGVMNIPAAPQKGESEFHSTPPSASKVSAPRAERKTELDPRVDGQDSSTAAERHVETTTSRGAIVPAHIYTVPSGEPREREMERTESMPGPIVRVSIGRVIVRAISATPPAPIKRETPSKKISLDEYLKKRERGER